MDMNIVKQDATERETRHGLSQVNGGTDELTMGEKNRRASLKTRKAGGAYLRKILIAAAVVAVMFAASTTIFANTDVFDRFVEILNPHFTDVVQPVMMYAEDQGMRLTIISAQSFGNMAVMHISLQEPTGEISMERATAMFKNRMTEWYSRPLDMSVTGRHYDETSNTMYMEVLVSSSHNDFPEELTVTVAQIHIGADIIELDMEFPVPPITVPLYVTGNWEVTVRFTDTSCQIIEITDRIYADNRIFTHIILTPVGMRISGTYTDNLRDTDVFAETDYGTVPMRVSGGGFWGDNFELLFWAEYPIDTETVTAIIFNNYKIPIGARKN